MTKVLHRVTVFDGKTLEFIDNPEMSKVTIRGVYKNEIIQNNLEDITFVDILSLSTKASYLLDTMKNRYNPKEQKTLQDKYNIFEKRKFNSFSYTLQKRIVDLMYPIGPRRIEYANEYNEYNDVSQCVGVPKFKEIRIFDPS